MGAWTALVRGYLAFIHARTVEMAGTTLKDGGSFVGSVASGSKKRKAALQKLKDDINQLKPAGKVVEDKLVPRITAAVSHIGKLGAALTTSPFTLGSATACAVHLGNLVTEMDAALVAIADAVAPEQTPEGKAAHDEITGMFAPLLSPFTNFAGNADKSFTEILDLLGIAETAKTAATQVKWDRLKGRLSANVGNTSEKQVGPLNLEKTSFEVFLDLLASPSPNLGIIMRTDMQVGLRGDKMLEKIIPGEPPTKDATSVAIQLDTKDGLTLGDGKSKRITLPLRWSIGGVELRERAISQPEAGNTDEKARIDITATVAGKFGAAVAVVAEGGGVKLEKLGAGGFVVSPMPPSGLGFRIDAGPVKGGGFLRYREIEKDYGGIIDLAIGKIGVTAIGMVSPDPFSFVVVIGVHFMPKVELSFGFTLNGIGGLLAMERQLSVDALGAALKDGVVSNLLFPNDPVAVAPTILNQLAAVFPPLPGGFVVGPIVELGWGSQAGLLRAKLGIVIALPDPKIVLLGSLQIVVPPPEVPKVPRLVDLKADLMTVIEPDQVCVRAALAQSQLGGVRVSGDLGLVVRWGGGAVFAMSAGGFYPQYTGPPQLSDMRRITVAMAPPVKWLELTAKAYFAMTSNSVQFGGAIDLHAEVGSVTGDAHFGVDALFIWSPKFAFSVRVAASVKIKWKSHTVAGASFKGTLSGTSPWTIVGNASVEILFWDVDFDLGPISWGDVDTEPLAKVDAMLMARDALLDHNNWQALPPPAADAIVRVRAAPPKLLLLQPHSVVRVKQTCVPFDTRIDRIGAFPSSVGQIGLTNPRIGDEAAGISGHVVEDFAPGQYLNLTSDQQMSRPAFEKMPAGFEMAGSAGIIAAPGVVEAAYKWETFFPLEPDPAKSRSKTLAAVNMHEILGSALKSSAVADKARRYANPYMLPIKGGGGGAPGPGPVIIADSGMKMIAAVDTLAATGIAMTTTAAFDALGVGFAGIGKQAVTMGLQK